MSENPAASAPQPDPDLAPVSDPAQAAPPSPPSASAAPARTPLRDRLFRFRSVVAVAAAGVVVGGAAGAGITALTDGHDSRPQVGRNGFGPGFRGGFAPGQGPGTSGGGPGVPGGPWGGSQGTQPGSQPSAQPSTGASS
jgi:hypothetical protein